MTINTKILNKILENQALHTLWLSIKSGYSITMSQHWWFRGKSNKSLTDEENQVQKNKQKFMKREKLLAH